MVCAKMGLLELRMSDENVERKRLSIEMKSTMHTDHDHIVWRTVYSPTGSGSHRTLINTAREEPLDSPRRGRGCATDVKPASDRPGYR